MESGSVEFEEFEHFVGGRGEAGGVFAAGLGEEGLAAAAALDETRGLADYGRSVVSLLDEVVGQHDGQCGASLVEGGGDEDRRSLGLFAQDEGYVLTSRASNCVRSAT